MEAPQLVPAMRQYAVYCNPVDYPGQIVVRRFTIFVGRVEPDPEPLYVGPSLDAARRCLPAKGLIRVPRQPQDLPSLVEVWL